MQLEVISLFPEMISSAAAWGVGGRALEQGLASLQCTNPREFATDSHQTVDDRPYGGGPGMVLKVEPVSAAIEAAKARLPDGAKVVFMSPQGRTLSHDLAQDLARQPGLLLVCGRYEGFDERLLEEYADLEVSLGDYVISGGELAALVTMDAVLRLLPGVLGDAASAEQDSFVEQRLDYPHYTRPEVYAGKAVPPVLLTGNHAEIQRWRQKQGLGRTWQRRPDLLEQRELSVEEAQLLEEFRAERAAKDAG